MVLLLSVSDEEQSETCEVGETWTFWGLETSFSACSRQTFSQGYLFDCSFVYLKIYHLCTLHLPGCS